VIGHLGEWWKLLFLACLLSYCGSSLFIDPWAPTGVAGRGTGVMGITVDLGVNLRSSCAQVVTDEAACKKSRASSSKQPRDETSQKSSGLLSFLQQVRGVTPDETNLRGGLETARARSEGHACGHLSQKVGDCRVAVREARQMIQLRCASQVLALWECNKRKDGVSADEVHCTEEQKIMATCAKPIAFRKLRSFQGANKAGG